LAVQYAAIAGATVVAVDLFEEKLNLAKELGATYSIDASKANPIEEIKKLGGADFAICVAFRQKHLNKPSCSTFDRKFRTAKRSTVTQTLSVWLGSTCTGTASRKALLGWFKPVLLCPVLLSFAPWQHYGGT
jgi:threonine dehydrogenase-like Zn-dependent dehydrogenase